jgi:hypothetical protein
MRLRIVIVRLGSRGVEIDQNDHVLTQASGGFWLPRLEPVWQARAALGELTDTGFAVRAVAAVVASAADDSFEPPNTPLDPELVKRARALAAN